MDTWRNIDTAPKDGTSILVGCGPYIAVAFWDEEGAYWALDDGHDYRPALRRELAQPTHWMPTPMPPGGVRMRHNASQRRIWPPR